MLTVIIEFGVGKFGAYRLVEKKKTFNLICHQLSLTFVDILGYLRNYLRFNDVVPYRLCRVCCDESDVNAKPFPNLQNHQHGHFQLRGFLGSVKSPEVDVFRSRRRTKRQCDEREHSTDGLPRGRSYF